MSGHSRSGDHEGYQKAAKDAKRSKVFAKLIKNIEVAARTGGGDVAGNPTLYDAVQKAKKTSVPNDNIDRAIKRGSGAGPTRPTGRPSRTRVCAGRGRGAHRVPHRQPQPGGRRGSDGADPQRRRRPRQCCLRVRPSRSRHRAEVQRPHRGRPARGRPRRGRRGGQRQRRQLRDRLDASDFVAIRTAVQAAGIDYESAEASWVPNLQVLLDLDGALKMIRVIDALEDSDDVQNVYANGEISDDVLAELDEDE